MKTDQNSFLHEEEHIVWESTAEQFKIQEQPFSTWNLVIWLSLAVVLGIYAIAYIPFAAANGTSFSGILLVGCIFAFIPAILTYNSIHDCSTIMNRLKYIITDKRAIIVNRDQYLSMDLTADTPYRIIERSNGTQILFLGSTIHSRLSQARKLAVIGAKGEKNNCSGLVFYSIPNADEACKAARLIK